MALPTAETVALEATPLNHLIRDDALPPKTTFITPPEFKQQVGLVVYSQGGQIGRRTHRLVWRQRLGASEALVVRDGGCLPDVCSDDHIPVATRQLAAGDVMLIAGGCHGFRRLGDSVLEESRHGAYTGIEEHRGEGAALAAADRGRPLVVLRTTQAACWASGASWGH